MKGKIEMNPLQTKPSLSPFHLNLISKDVSAHRTRCCYPVFLCFPSPPSTKVARSKKGRRPPSVPRLTPPPPPPSPQNPAKSNSGRRCASVVAKRHRLRRVIIGPIPLLWLGLLEREGRGRGRTWDGGGARRWHWRRVFANGA